ncbi:MAG: hypothetical protein HY303_21615 [Candidatus Wallbacteria bacterium]|nr:hypothetical protein [Candidatus Wallbacteria bacterium]
MNCDNSVTKEERVTSGFPRWTAPRKLALAAALFGLATAAFLAYESDRLSVLEAALLVGDPQTTAEYTVGSLSALYSCGAGPGCSGLLLVNSGEFKTINLANSLASDEDTLRGTYDVTDDLVTLSPDSVASGSLPGTDRGPLEYRCVRWGCCKYLVPKDAMAEFCRAANGGRYNPRLTSAQERFYRSRNCTGPHMPGIPHVSAEWAAMLLPKPVEAHVTRVTAEQVRIDAGRDKGIREGMLFYSDRSGGRIFEYEVTRVYERSCELREQRSRVGSSRLRRGATLNSRYPAPLDEHAAAGAPALALSRVL